MFRIVYTSTLSSAVGRAEIDAILEEARERNARDDVTGAWLMHGRACLSALEGPPEAVRQIGESVWDDRRHENFRLCDMRPVSQRLFRGWPLHYLDVSDGNSDALNDHDGLRWLCTFAGGVEAFAAKGLGDGLGELKRGDPND